MQTEADIKRQRVAIIEILVRESQFIDRLPTLGDFIATAIAVHQFVEHGTPWTGLPQQKSSPAEILAGLPDNYYDQSLVKPYELHGGLSGLPPSSVPEVSPDYRYEPSEMLP